MMWKYGQYLDVGMVLFGQPYNARLLPPPHPTERQDGLIVVHQFIARHPHRIPTPIEKQGSFELQASRQLQRLTPSQQHRPKSYNARVDVVDMAGEVDSDNQAQDMDIEEYMPQQFGVVASKDQEYTQKEGQHYDHVPFSEEEEEERKEEKAEKEEGEEVDMEIEEATVTTLEEMLPV